MSRGVKILLGALTASFVVWTICAVFGVAGQRKLFYEEGQEEMYDYWMPRMCVEQGYSPAKSIDYGINCHTGGVRGCDKPVGEIIEFSDWYPSDSGLRFVTGDMDKVYPALALMPYKFFPATRAGAWWFSSLCAVIFLLSLILISTSTSSLISSSSTSPSSLPPPHLSFLLALSAPFIFALERGNPVWLSAAAVGVFLAWWDDERQWKRYVAALALAFAAVMKIAPGVLGLLYLVDHRKGGFLGFWRYWKEIVFAALVALVLFVVPWFFVREGFAAISIMFKNAAHHADFVLRTSDFGFVQLWRTVRVVLGLNVHEPWSGMYLAARLSQGLGLVALLVGARRRDYLLLIGGMLFAAGNMYYYAALYLLPVFVLHVVRNRPVSSVSLFLVFLILCPWQFVLFGHSGNAVLCNLAVLSLMTLRLLKSTSKSGY